MAAVRIHRHATAVAEAVSADLERTDNATQGKILSARQWHAALAAA